MGGFIFFIIVAGVFTLIIALVYKQKMRTLETWSMTADSLGLRFNNGGWALPSKIFGEVNNNKVTVKTATRGSGKNSHTVTEYNIDYAMPVEFKFKLTKQHLLHSFGKMFGMQDIEVGDSSFDDSVVVQGSDAARIKDFLTAPRRKHIKKILELYKEVAITNHGIEVVTRGMESSLQKLKSTIETLCAMAAAVQPSRGKEHPVEQAKKARENGDISRAVEIIANATGLSEDEMLEVDEMKGELHYVGNDPEKASKIFDELSKNLDDDHHSKQWAEHATSATGDKPKKATPPPLPSQDTETPQEQPTPVETTSEKASTPTAPADTDLKMVETTPEASEGTAPSSSDAITIEDFCATLFKKDMGAFDSTKKFDSDFKGREVSWRGKLVSVASFSFDFVFKDGGGVKAAFEIFDLESKYSKTKIKANVRFPEEKLDELKTRVGSENVEFTGRLLSLDGLTKNIFIA